MTDELDPLPPEISFALEVERARPAPPADQLARLQARLDATFIPPTPPSVGAPAASSALAGKVGLLVAGLVVGTVAGSQLQLHYGEPREVIVEKRVEIPVRVEVPVAVPVPSDDGANSLSPRERVGVRGPEVAPAIPTKEPVRAPIELERLLVEQATAALGRGKGEDALAACREHAQRFPSGQLAEEREIVAIRALMLLGRRADAEVRAAEFRAKFPESLLIDVVNEALK